MTTGQKEGLSGDNRTERFNTLGIARQRQTEGAVLWREKTMLKRSEEKGNRIALLTGSDRTGIALRIAGRWRRRKRRILIKREGGVTPEKAWERKGACCSHECKALKVDWWMKGEGALQGISMKTVGKGEVSVAPRVRQMALQVTVARYLT